MKICGADVTLGNRTNNILETFKVIEQGALELNELVSIAENWAAEGRKDDLPKLYQTWIDHTSSPLSYIAYYNYATILHEAKNFSQAEVLYRKALEHNPKFIEAHINLGTCLIQQHRVDEALEKWRETLNIPEIRLPAKKVLQLKLLNDLGLQLETTGHFYEALLKFSASFTIDPSQLDIINNLAFLRQKMCIWPVIQPPLSLIHI